MDEKTQFSNKVQHNYFGKYNVAFSCYKNIQGASLKISYSWGRKKHIFRDTLYNEYTFEISYLYTFCTKKWLVKITPLKHFCIMVIIWDTGSQKYLKILWYTLYLKLWLSVYCFNIISDEINCFNDVTLYTVEGFQQFFPIWNFKLDIPYLSWRL